MAFSEYYNKEMRKANRAGELSGTDLARFKEDRGTAAGRWAANTLTGPIGAMVLNPIRERKDLAKEYGRQAEDMGDLERPDYEIPSAVLEAAAAGKREYESDRTYSEGVMADRVQGGLANSVAAASKFGNTGDVLNTIARGQQTAQEGYQNIGMMSEKRRANAFGNYLSTRKMLGDAQTSQWMYNKYQPYYDSLNQQRELQAGATAMNLQAGDMQSQLVMEGMKTAGQLGAAYITGGGSLALGGLGGGSSKGLGNAGYYDIPGNNPSYGMS